jgi:hypothetical protein
MSATPGGTALSRVCQLQHPHRMDRTTHPRGRSGHRSLDAICDPRPGGLSVDRHVQPQSGHDHVGQISHANGRPMYDEWLYKDGRVIMHSWALCQWDNRAPPPTPPIIAPPPPSPPIIAQAPTPPAPSSPPDRTYPSPDNPSASIDSGGDDSVPIVSNGRKARVMVGLGGSQVSDGHRHGRRHAANQQ